MLSSINKVVYNLRSWSQDSHPKVCKTSSLILIILANSSIVKALCLINQICLHRQLKTSTHITSRFTMWLGQQQHRNKDLNWTTLNRFRKSFNNNWTSLAKFSSLQLDQTQKSSRQNLQKRGSLSVQQRQALWAMVINLL